LKNGFPTLKNHFSKPKNPPATLGNFKNRLEIKRIYLNPTKSAIFGTGYFQLAIVD
jgi:hypothetical protein